MFSTGVPHYSPLLVRSPNLNAWLQDAVDDGAWPGYWTLNDPVSHFSSPNATIMSLTFVPKALGLGGMIRVDGKTSPWMGKPVDDKLKTGFVEQTMTPTSTIRKFKVGGVDLDVAFLSPIEVLVI